MPTCDICVCPWAQVLGDLGDHKEDDGCTYLCALTKRGSQERPGWGIIAPQRFPAPKRMLCLGGGVPSHVGSPSLGTVSWVLVSSHTESFPLGPLVCFHCHGQRQAAGSESCIESRVNTGPCLFPLGEINK